MDQLVSGEIEQPEVEDNTVENATTGKCPEFTLRFLTRLKRHSGEKLRYSGSDLVKLVDETQKEILKTNNI